MGVRIDKAMIAAYYAQIDAAGLSRRVVLETTLQYWMSMPLETQLDLVKNRQRMLSEQAVDREKSLAAEVVRRALRKAPPQAPQERRRSRGKDGG